MDSEETFFGVFGKDGSAIQVYTIVPLGDELHAVGRSPSFIDYSAGAKVNTGLELLVDMGVDGGRWTTRTDDGVYRFHNRSDAEFILQRLVALGNGAVDKEVHAAELRLSLVLADLYTGGDMSRVEPVDANEILRLEKVAVTMTDEDPVIMFLITALSHDDTGTVRRQFLATRSAVTAQASEWTDKLDDARFFFSKGHAVNSAWWILRQGSIGYHRMGGPEDDLYQEMTEHQGIELPGLRLTDSDGRLASFCAFQAKTKSRTKTGISRDISGEDDSLTSSTSGCDVEFARFFLKQRTIYVYLIVEFASDGTRRFKVDTLRKRQGRYFVEGREIFDDSDRLGDKCDFEVEDVRKRDEISDTTKVLITTRDALHAPVQPWSADAEPEGENRDDGV